MEMEQVQTSQDKQTYDKRIKQENDKLKKEIIELNNKYAELLHKYNALMRFMENKL